MQQASSKNLEPANIVKKGQEPEWNRAKNAAAKYFKLKSPDQLKDDQYAFVTFLFKQFTGQENEECDTQGNFPQTTRAGTRKTESNKGIKIGFKPTLKEAEKGKIPGKKYEIVIIQEGLGNLKDVYYYSKQAIESAIKIFEGAAIYANHPGPSEEQEHPERTVEKKVGHIENTRVQKSDDGRFMCVGEAHILEGETYDWVRTLLNHSLKYQERYKDKDFIGFSINASGDSKDMDAEDLLEEAPESAREKIQEAIAMGNETIRVVTEITDCVSCDLVTKAGAGGRVLKILEEDKVAKRKIREADGEEKKPHADEDQDKELISDMIKKHMGDKSTEESMKAVHENAKAYMETGMEEEEAVKHAVAEHKKETIKKEKQEAASHEEEEEGSHHEEEEAHHEEGDDDMEKKEGDQKPPVHESDKGTKKGNENLQESESIKLSARVALLESELKKERLGKYVDKKLAECGLPRLATKKFLETCGGEFASQKDFDLKFKIFSEAYKETASVDYTTGNDKGGGGEATGSMSLADCVVD